MSTFIKFWLAKELAGLLIALAIVAIPVSILLFARTADWISSKLRGPR
jgi:hypothetical protein